MSTHAEMSKRGELHSKLWDLIEEHGMQELLWMVGQIVEDRGEVLIFAEANPNRVVHGEHLKNAKVGV